MSRTLVAVRIPNDVVREMDKRGKRSQTIVAALESYLGMESIPAKRQKAIVGQKSEGNESARPSLADFSDEDLAETEIPICGLKWWEDGTEYECLMDAGHRAKKHGQNGMVRVVSE